MSSPETVSRSRARERLAALLSDIRVDVAAVTERLGAAPFRPQFAQARALGLELDEIQRNLSYFHRDVEPGLSWVLQHLRAVCAGELGGVRERLAQAALLARLVDGQPGPPQLPEP